MGTCRDPVDEDDAYYEQVLGSTIVAVHQDGESVWFHLLDGGLIEVMAEPTGGFSIEIHPNEDETGEIPEWLPPALPTD